MTRYFVINIILVVSLLSFNACKKDDTLNTLSISVDQINIEAEGGSSSFVIETNADSWSIENPGNDWISLSKTTGALKEALISINVESKTPTIRTDTLIITAGNAKPAYLVITQAASEYLYTLSSSVNNLTFKQVGNVLSFEINSTAPEWNIQCDAEWVSLNSTSGTDEKATIEVTTIENDAIDYRTSIIYLTGQYAPPVEIAVKQNGYFYPSYNTSPLDPDITGMGSTAVELASKIKLGWNLGNSLEATGGETGWGNPQTSQALINLVKNNGFNAVRLPCAWAGHLSNANKAEINTDWLARVKDVIQYCVNNDMYVVLNIHWDGGWLENNCTPYMQEANNAKQKAFWEQIATYFRDYDEHLIFASANEPNVDDATQMAVLKSYHQTCIDAVRSTGGKNTYRTIVVQGPRTDITKTNKLMTSLPTDPTPNRMMAEVHYYTPWNFCGMTADANWGNMFYYWGEGYHSDTDTDHNATDGEEDDVKRLFELMQTQFVRKGIPVVMGEYGAIRRSALTGDALTDHLNSRAYYLKYVTQQAKAYGLLPFYWDNGGTDNNAFGLFNRKTNTVYDQQALDALVEGAQ